MILQASISPHLLRYRAFAVVHYNCMPCALYLRQTRRLQDSGVTISVS